MPTDKKISELPIASSINASDISILIDNGADYQYTFTTLLQFLAANLAVGANISFGTVLPQNTTGANGDVFVNTSAGSFAQKLSNTWTVVYTLSSGGTADGTLLYGAGTPSPSTGKDTDSYINTLTGIFYKKASGTWSQVFSMATGPQGPQGVAGTNGTNGTNGNTILFGNGNPSNSTTGNNGDFYINTANYQFFGPKASGTWPAGVSIIGADGAAGAAGTQGTAGATGATGATGAAGPGVATGGATGQVLAKVDGTDYNTHWVGPVVPEQTPQVTGSALTFVNDAVYGSKAFPETGDITADITAAKLGVTNLIIHNTGAAPTFDSKFRALSGSAVYASGQLNYIFCTYIAADEIIYSINQRT